MLLSTNSHETPTAENSRFSQEHSNPSEPPGVHPGGFDRRSLRVIHDGIIEPRCPNLAGGGEAG